MSELINYVMDRHKAIDASLELTYKTLGGTKKKFTRLLNAPDRARLEDVLRLAGRIEVHPLTLINEYGMGKLMITETDKLQLATNYRLEQTHKSALRNANRIPHIPKSAGAKIAGANP